MQSVLRPHLLEQAVDCGLRSLFVGFETLSAAALRSRAKHQNLNNDYAAAVRRLRGREGAWPGPRRRAPPATAKETL